MPISINNATRVIYIPQNYLTPTAEETHGGISIYEMDVNAFRLDLKAWEASEAGANMPDTHRHNSEIVLGGVTYARFVEIINGYSLLFEEIGDPIEHYMVRLKGANNNLAEVSDLHGQVSMLTNNSAGLAVEPDESALVTAAVFAKQIEGSITMQSALRLIISTLMGKVSVVGDVASFRDTGDTKNRVVATFDQDGNRTAVTLDGS